MVCKCGGKLMSCDQVHTPGNKIIRKRKCKVGDIHLQPDYYIDDSGVSLSDILSDLCRGAERLKGVVDVVSVVKNRDHYAKHEAYNRI